MSAATRLLLNVLRVVLPCVVLAFLVWRVAGDWDEFVAGTARVGPDGIAISLVAAVLGLAMTGMAWRALLAGLGYPLGVRDAFAVFFPAQLTKYVPGGIWPYLAQARLGRRYAVPPSLSSMTAVLFGLIHVISGAVVGAALLGIASGAVSTSGAGWVLWLVPLLTLLVHPRVIHALMRTARRITGRGTVPERPLPWKSLLQALAWMLPAWAAYGLSLFAILAPLGARSLDDLVAGTGAYATAWTVGFLASAVLVFVAPAGLGTREAALYTTLVALLPPGPAQTAVVLSRVAHTLADLLWALTALAVRSMRAPDPGHGPGDRS